MTPYQALYALGLDYADLLIIRRDLLDALASATRDLLESFGKD